MLKVPFFANYFFSRILSSTSFQMLSVAIGWQMYAITHDAFSLGFVGLAQFMPMVLLTLVVGHVADRFNRRTIVVICQMLEGIVAALLFFGNSMGWLGREQILVAAAILGACRAFENPSSSSLLPQIVRKDILPQAIAWSTSAGQTALILGPSLGGILYSVGPTYVYMTATIALLIAGGLTYRIHVNQSVQKTGSVSGLTPVK